MQTRVKAWRVSVATVATAAVVSQAVVPLAQAAEDVAEGYVDWGIRESWRNYMGVNNTTLADGVTYNEDGTYRWPVTAGSYDADTETLELTLSGSVHYQQYCFGSSCVLDSKFSNLSLVIAPDEAFIQGDYAGVLRSAMTAGVQTFEDVRIADLDVSTATQSTADDWTYYSDIAAVAGAGMYLYDAGETVDPVDVAYRLDEATETESSSEEAPSTEEAPSSEVTPSTEEASSSAEAPSSEAATSSEEAAPSSEAATSEEAPSSEAAAPSSEAATSEEAAATTSAADVTTSESEQPSSDAVTTTPAPEATTSAETSAEASSAEQTSAADTTTSAATSEPQETTAVATPDTNKRSIFGLRLSFNWMFNLQIAGPLGLLTLVFSNTINSVFKAIFR